MMKKVKRAKAFYIINVNSHLNGKVSGEKSVSYITMSLQVFLQAFFLHISHFKAEMQIKRKSVVCQ